MTKKTKLKLPSMGTGLATTDKKDNVFSNKMWTQSYDELMKAVDDPTITEIVSIDVKDFVLIETRVQKYIMQVINIDEEFNLITVVDDQGETYFWDETPDQRLLESTSHTSGISNKLETIINISKVQDKETNDGTVD
tara:strand:+ start:362 stop:772 length:411 start_codon:yes stop_codon:yes gene_type:complete